MGLDRLKRGRGPLMVKTVAGTLVVVLCSSVYSMVNLQKREIEDGGAVNPTDQVLMAKHLLEATLMGILSFALLIHFLFISWNALCHLQLLLHYDYVCDFICGLKYKQIETFFMCISSNYLY